MMEDHVQRLGSAAFYSLAGGTRKIEKRKDLLARCDDLRSKIILLSEQRNIWKYFKVLGRPT